MPTFRAFSICIGPHENRHHNVIRPLDLPIRNHEDPLMQSRLQHTMDLAILIAIVVTDSRCAQSSTFFGSSNYANPRGRQSRTRAAQVACASNAGRCSSWISLNPCTRAGRYDFFSGHFDISATRFIPRDDIETVALFREPRARLISFYRFLRSHPLGDEFAGDQLIPLAHELTAEEFFENPQLRLFSAVNNHYLFALGSSFAWFDQNRSSLSREALSRVLEDAKLQIRALTALGITERFDDSIQLIWKSLNFPTPSSTEEANVTDKIVENDLRFRRVEPVGMTPRLATAIADLIEYDDILYEFAVQEFNRRFAERQSTH